MKVRSRWQRGVLAYRSRSGRVLLSAAVAGLVALSGGVAWQSSPADAASGPKPKPTAGPSVVEAKTIGSGLTLALHGSGTMVSFSYTTSPDPTSCSESCMILNITGQAPLSVNAGPCNLVKAPSADDLQPLATIGCNASALGESVTFVTDGMASTINQLDVADCPPASVTIKGGLGPDVLNLAGGCYITVTCGDAVDENGEQTGGFDTVDATKSSVNPSIGDDCEYVNNKFVHLPSGSSSKTASKTTAKKTTAKKTTKKKR